MTTTARRAEPDLTATDFHYLDCFESTASIGEDEEPAVWLLRGFAATPAWIKELRRRLLGTGGEWTVLDQTPTLVHLTQPTPIGEATVVARTVDGRRRMTTAVTFASGRGRAVWALIGAVHRRTERRIVSGLQG
jgi:hypothetical protein